MKRLFVCSEPDIPSANMRDCLLNIGDWDTIGSLEGENMMKSGDTYMLSSSRWHIEFEDVIELSARFGVDPELVVFMSRHSSASGRPALTVHPIGNFKENKLGGKPKKLVKASPGYMTDALRRIHALNDMDGTEVSFEVTHHGPWVDRPTFFIEVGSDVKHWENKHAANILAHVLVNNTESKNPVVIGVGGGHYAPRFTEAALSLKVDFGHMIPNYHLDDSDHEDLARMLRDASEATDTKLVFLHRKSMKGLQASKIKDVVESEGLELVQSSDFEPIDH
ncbi:MAG TPA: D-aminoacyl-tRNA deacylase [Candidatus Methanomethylophilaceae archaeon]|nr:D-aminoacyl-tRNA deacylase [Candidatus Methanomethylophilaceae archaeon]